MPIEPPVTSPRDLEAAYAVLAAAAPDAPARAIAGGTDLMVALTGELGEPPASLVDLWASDALRGIVPYTPLSAYPGIIGGPCSGLPCESH